MRQNQNQINKNALSILTLDDDPIITATIQAYFQRSGYRVDVENEPYAAIERVRSGNYDILLLDFLMSPICGDQVVEQIRRFNRDIYIILLTGHKSLAPPIKTIRALDIQGYYEKNDRFDQLELLVESCRKSIQQMKTIRSYKSGLTTLVDSLPALHDLSSMDNVQQNIVETAATLIPCRTVTLMLEKSDWDEAQGERYAAVTQGEEDAPLSDKEVEQLLFRVRGENSILWGKKVVLPLVGGVGRLMGILLVEPGEDIAYDQLQLLEVFGRQASSALRNAMLHTEVQEKNNQLQTNYFEMIHTMRRVVDMKDPYTRGHSDRVSFYACQIARCMGKEEEYCEHVRIAGLFHDMGKISIPDEVLLKPSRLTDEEFAVIRGHSASGTELLSAVSQFRDILSAVRSHHERFDGGGYPDHLMGDAIPEDARIIAVADTFDAMTSNRQYRKALTLQQACEELERCKNTQLDSRVVDAFKELADSGAFWEKAREEMGDNMPDQLLLDVKQYLGG